MAKRIALVYLVLGLSWITFSSWTLQKMGTILQLSIQQIFWLESWKGYAYVTVTAIVLYGFLHRLFTKRRNADKQFRRLFDDNPNPMWVFDAETLRFLAVNRAMLEEYGYSQEELLGMTIKDIRPAESIEALEKRLQEEIPSYSKSGIWCHRRKNGELFYVRIYSNTTEYNGRKCRLVMAFDISPIIHAEQENRILTNRLAKKERHLRSLIDSQTTFLIRIDTQGQHTFVNQAYCQKLDYRPESIIGQPFTQDTHPEDQKYFEDVITKCLRQPGQVQPLIIHKYNTAGEIRILEWEFVAIKTVNAKITELQGMGRDVTEEFKSVEKIKEYTQRINDILESITDGFYAIDKNWNFTYVNKEFERILHCKREEIMGNSLWDQFPELKSLKFYSEYQRAMTEQVKVQFEEYYPRFRKWFGVSAYPSVDGLTVYFQDITQEKLAQEKDFENTQNLNALINNPNALIWSVNRDYQLITANQPFLEQLALTTGRYLQKGDSVLYPNLNPEINAKWIALYERAFQGEIYTVEDQLITANKEVNYVEISFNPIRDRDGNITGTGCFSRDITETKRHQLKIQEQNEKLKEIAWIQSHKVRVPVANILGLIHAFNYKNLADPFNLEVLANLNIVTHDLDTIIRDIVNKTNEVEDNPHKSPNNKLMLGDRISTRIAP
ncbi:hypothetical protein AHMF7605_02585 [Adhaeribacter arboris]|uniref:PAS domain S-box protein n=1 Tax=Adhaeribacter arboris TaxID=2072846 RepID=A0A2T2YAF3_9BACT|nr:PAS domain S-box protein [Adhaeribacter arboris]PSR52487.1 hypothetical protein AHMF7605_02585 [Adhaeribacter arboris]